MTNNIVPWFQPKPDRRSQDDQFAQDGLANLELVLSVLPLDSLAEALQQLRRHGRNDYPPKAMLSALVARIVLGLDTITDLVKALRCNPYLMRLCGFEIDRQLVTRRRPVQVKKGGKDYRMDEPKWRWRCPTSSAFTRFHQQLAQLEQRDGLFSELLAGQVETLMELLPDFGRQLGFDGKWVASWASGQAVGKAAKDTSPEPGQGGQADARRAKPTRTGDPDADWGVKRIYKKGAAKVLTQRCFGYKLHVISDVKYEVPLQVKVTPASGSEIKALESMLPQLFKRHSQLPERCNYLTADRGLDSGPFKAQLWDQWQIRPIIDQREMWRVDEKQPDVVKGPSYSKELKGQFNIAYDENGELHCYCPETDRRRAMLKSGYEQDRGTLKFRCPAKDTCKGFEECLQHSGSQAYNYGRVVRVPLDLDRRLFTPTQRSSPTWKRQYQTRSATERVNSQLGKVCGLDTRTTRGLANTRLKALLSMAIMQATAIGSIHNRQPQRMRSLLSPGLPQAA